MPGESDRDRRFLWKLMVTLVAVAGLILAWQLVSVLLILFGAVVTATLLRALAEPLARRTHLPHGAALAIVVVAILALVAAAVWFAWGQFDVQAAGVASGLHQAIAAVKERMRETSLGQAVLNEASRMRLGGGDALHRVTSVAGSFTDLVFEILLSLVGGVYVAAQPGLYYRGALLLAPISWRDPMATTAVAVDRTLRRWLLAQLTAMVIVGVVTGLGMSMVGAPSPLALGVLAGFLEFVPYFGPLMSGGVAVLLAFTVSFDTALWALAVATGIQQMENHILMPLLQRSMVSIPPMVTMLSIFGFGVLLGPLGVLMAGPLTVSVFAGVARWRGDRRSGPS